MTDPRTPTPLDIEAAAARIRGHVRRTPVIRIEAGELAPCPVILKLESLQHAGSFKPRGAFNTLLQQDPLPRRVIAASGGNHGIAVAHAARSLGLEAEIFVPLISSPVKVERLRRLGASVRQTGRDYAEALAAMRERQAETGALDIHAYDAPATVAGQGTLAMELEEQAGDMQAALFAVGGGGLIGGALAWMGTRVPVIGVPVQSKALKGLDSLLSIVQMPAGVPVATMSPGSSVNAVERCSTSAKQSKISSFVFDSCRSSPFTQVRKARPCGSPSSSGVTIQGPIGPCVSKLLPIVIVGVRSCQSRTVTSSTTR